MVSKQYHDLELAALGKALEAKVTCSHRDLTAR